MSFRPNINVCFAFLLLLATATGWCPKAYAADDNVVVKSQNEVHRLIAGGSRLTGVKSDYETTYSAARVDDEVLATKLFGEHVEMLKASAPGVKPYYRSWEPEGMFHTGTRICALNVPLKRGKLTKVTFATMNRWPEQFCGLTLAWPHHVEEANVQVLVPAPLAGRYEVVPYKLTEGMTLDKKTGSNGDVCYTLRATDIPPFRSEPGAPSAAVDAPQLFITGHFENVDSLYSYLKSFTDNPAHTDASVENLARRITSACTDPVQKIDSISAWVRSNIRYLAVENGEYALKPMPAQDVLARRYGDCKGSANLIKEMLKSVGVDGRLAWMGTRGEVPSQWSEMPSLLSGNHQIACAVINDSILYIDGTAAYAPDGYLPWGIRGRQVIVEDGDRCIVAKLPDSSRHPDKEELSGAFTIDGDKLVGSIYRKYSGMYRAYIANICYSRDVNARNDFLEQLLTFPKKNMAAPDARLVLESFSAPDCEAFSESVVDNGAVKNVGNRSYVDLRPIRTLGYETVDLDGRKRGLAAKPCSEYEAEITLQLPPGWGVEQLPDDCHLENEWFIADVRYESREGCIAASARVIPQDADVPFEKLQEYNNAIKALKRMSQAQIVLKNESK